MLNPCTVREAAALLAVSEATIKRRCEDGVIRARKSGRSWRIDRGALLPHVEVAAGAPLDPWLAQLDRMPMALTADAAAEFLGVTPYAIHRAMDAETIPSVTFGTRSRRVSTPGLRRLLTEGTVR